MREIHIDSRYILKEDYVYELGCKTDCWTVIQVSTGEESYFRTYESAYDYIIELMKGE